MANTFTQIYLQFVFAVQDRISLIRFEWKDELYKYITGIVQNNNHKLIAINGMPDQGAMFLSVAGRYRFLLAIGSVKFLR